MDFFYERKELRIEPNKSFNESQRIAHLVWIGWREDGAERRLGRAFEHRLALFVETGNDGILLFEANEKARQWRLVVAALFEVFP